MTRHVYALKEAEKMVPLLSSIGKEINSRRCATKELEKRLADLVRGGAVNSYVCRNLEEEIAEHTRQIRSSEYELKCLGCRLDTRHPFRILIPSSDGAWAYDHPAGGIV